MERYFEINEQGHNIRCKLYCRDPRAIREAVIFGHGFGGHKDNAAAARFADRLTAKRKNAALITFNWPCHGDDVKKKLYLQDCLTYLELVVQQVRSRYQPENLYAHATSFGGYLTLLYIQQRENPFRKIVLRCPAVNMFEVLSSSIMSDKDREALRRGREISVGFDRKVPVSPAFLQALEEADIRKLDYLDYAEDILILHGTRDEIVPIGAAETFCENNLIEFRAVEDADHRFRDPLKMDLAIKYTLEFFGFW